MPYPLEERASSVSESDVSIYIQTLFHGVQWEPQDFVCFRGIGEKGTEQYGSSSDEPVQPHFIDLVEKSRALGELWAQYEYGAFIIPAILKDSKATASNVKALTSVLVDIDTGETLAKLRWLTKHIGKPTMVVKSGGKTQEGHFKTHCYYVLDKPCDEVSRVVVMRDKLARAVGGDLSFGLGTDNNPYGRAHQPVRIAGTVHAKEGTVSPCVIADGSYDYFDIDWLEKRLSRLPESEWQVKKEPKFYEIHQASGNAPSMMFSPEASRGVSGRYEEAMREEIHEGGEPPHTRWHTFSVVAGEHIRQHREGEISESEARQKTYQWMQDKMVPPWPDGYFDKQWDGLVRYDKAHHALAPAQAEPAPEPIKKKDDDKQTTLKDYAAHRWYDPKNVPRRKWLVDGLVMAGKPQSFIAGGGAGKTYSLLDLAAKVATFTLEKDQYWFGQRIRRGGTVVLVLHEDDMEELQIRLHELGLDEAVAAAGDKLIILPTLNLGGAFPLVMKDLAGNTIRHPNWEKLKAMLKEIDDLAWFAIDTYAMIAHGSENDSSTIRDIMGEVSDVCQHTGAAFTLTHHINKGVRGEPIRNAQDMLDAVRGSTAFTGCFRVNLGMWPTPDWREASQALGIEAKQNQLWNAAIIKANNPEVFQGTKTLLREQCGRFEDVTQQIEDQKPSYEEVNAWLLVAIKEAAKRGHPYTNGGRGVADGLYRRKAELPPKIQRGEQELKIAREKLLKTGAIVACAARGSTSKKYLDVPDGPLASDDEGADLNRGAYQDRPDWSGYEYNATLGMVVRK